MGEHIWDDKICFWSMMVLISFPQMQHDFFLLPAWQIQTSWKFSFLTDNSSCCIMANPRKCKAITPLQHKKFLAIFFTSMAIFLHNMTSVAKVFATRLVAEGSLQQCSCYETSSSLAFRNKSHVTKISSSLIFCNKTSGAKYSLFKFTATRPLLQNFFFSIFLQQDP